MRIFVFFLVFSCNISSTFCQELGRSIFKDAVNYKKNPDSRNGINQYYGIDESNKFFTLSEINSFNEGMMLTNHSFDKKYPNFNVTNPADYLATFIVNRVKKELAINFFNKFSETIRNKKIKDLSVLFYYTFLQLEMIDEKIYNYEEYLEEIKSSLQSDFKRLPTSFKKLIEDSNSQLGSVINKDKNLKYLVNHSLNIIEEIVKKEHPGEVLAGMDFSTSDASVNKNFVGSLKSLQLFSEAFKTDGSAVTYWISTQDVKVFKEDPDVLRYFIGLIAAQAKQMDLSLGGKTLFELMNDKAGNIISFHKLIDQIVKTTNSINEVIHENQLPLISDEEKSGSFLSYSNTITDFFRLSYQISESILGDKVKVDKFSCILSSVNSFMFGFEAKQPSTALLGLTNFLGCLDSKDDNLGKLLRFIESKSEFIGDIQKAKTKEEIIALIDRVAAPIGSWRDKRTASFNMAIDSYTGGSYLESSDTSYFAISTPVGVSMSTLVCNCLSVTVLGSIIDIGPLTAYRFRNSEKQIAKIYLKEIYSPGVHVSLGFGKQFIFTLNGSWQKFTTLQSIDGDQSMISSTKREGFTVGASVNIPLYTLINQKK